MTYKILVVVQIACCILPAQSTPREQQRRTAAIAATRHAIEAECRQHGGANWDEFFARLAPFRKSLLGKIEEAKARHSASPDAKKNPASAPLLESIGIPPFFYDANSAAFLANPTGAQEWVKARTSLSTIVATSKWLKQKFGIDLLFVPVPTVVEVYPDRFADSVPAHRIAAPHVRALLAELLQNDVEVLDLLPAFLKARDAATEPLYFPTDPHWSGAGMKIAAREIAARLHRYAFVQNAAKAPAKFKAQDIRVPYNGYYFGLLPAARQTTLRQYQQAGFSRVTDLSGALLKETRTSPILVVGDSYVAYSTLISPGTGLETLVSKELNMQAGRVSVEGGAFAAIVDIVRDPELRKSCKVLVWTLTMRAVAQDPWALPGFLQK